MSAPIVLCQGVPQGEEDWRDVVGFEGYYQVSSLGRVKSVARLNARGRRLRERILRPIPDCYRRFRVSLYRPGIAARPTCIHRLVANAFLGDLSAGGLEVCHGPLGVEINAVSNLRWDTHANNQADMIAHGTSTRGERNPQAKLTVEQVYAIRSQEGVAGMREVARCFGVTKGAVDLIWKRQRWGYLPNEPAPLARGATA